MNNITKKMFKEVEKNVSHYKCDFTRDVKLIRENGIGRYLWGCREKGTELCCLTNQKGLELFKLNISRLSVIYVLNVFMVSNKHHYGVIEKITSEKAEELVSSEVSAEAIPSMF